MKLVNFPDIEIVKDMSKYVISTSYSNNADMEYIKKLLLIGVDENECTKCWDWCGTMQNKTSPVIKYRTAVIGAHKLSYCISRNIPEYLYNPQLRIIRLCSNTRCVNPKHLSSNFLYDVFNRSYKIDNETNCWNWTGFCSKDGYGKINISEKALDNSKNLITIRPFNKTLIRSVTASRYSYILFRGHIPKVSNIKDRLCVCHTCDNPKCVNPEHLFLGTYKDNSNDKLLKNRQIKGEYSPKTKLKNADILKIRELSKQGVFAKIIAKQFNISVGGVYHITHGRTWRHLL